MGRGVSAGGGQSSLGYLFGGGGEPAPNPNPSAAAGATTTHNGEAAATAPAEKRGAPSPGPAAGASKEIPAGVPAAANSANNYFRAEGQNCGNFLTDRPTTKVHAAPGGGSSLDYLFGGEPKK
ncbi:hypothetical protein Tsubulata_017515 [Turnera subulata]|uniref:Uncharacterized protein n=1 Tax=Turnera subulata TaxID=218843 RepID=A0A9Q0FJF6_9ROSI|nr:hypothetical protein Tsubulata_017515 [Turnera subulata]